MPVPDPPPVPEDDYIDDQEWVNQAPKGLRVPGVIGALMLLLFAVCGFWGGSALQKHHDKSSTSAGAAAASTFAASAGRRGAAAGGTGTAGAAAGGGGRTTGIVTGVQGSTVLLTDGSGNLVKVNLTPTSTITKSASATAGDIQLGQTVIVTGTTGSDGETTAGSVTIAPAGGSAGTGGDPTAGGGPSSGG